MISTFTVFVDANVFYGARLRSLILYLAKTKLFRARWSEDIHREWMASCAANIPDLTLDKLERTRRLMDYAISDCLVRGYEPLIEKMDLPDRDDRHVLAAAITAHAEFIVTFNVRDFPEDKLAPFGIQTITPDDLVLDLLDIDECACLRAIQGDVDHYKAPPLKMESYLADLNSAGLSRTADYLRKCKFYTDQISMIGEGKTI